MSETVDDVQTAPKVYVHRLAQSPYEYRKEFRDGSIAVSTNKNSAKCNSTAHEHIKRARETERGIIREGNEEFTMDSRNPNRLHSCRS